MRGVARVGAREKDVSLRGKAVAARGKSVAAREKGVAKGKYLCIWNLQTNHTIVHYKSF